MNRDNIGRDRTSRTDELNSLLGSDGDVYRVDDAPLGNEISMGAMEDNMSMEVMDEPMAYGNKYTVTIDTLNYGYSVRVGCQSFAFETNESLISALATFLKDPYGTERLWNDGKFLKKN